MAPALRELTFCRETDINEIITNKGITATVLCASKERYFLVWELREGEFDPERKVRVPSLRVR